MIKTVGVLGCGVMGSGIAQVSATAGFRTIAWETTEGLLEAGLGKARKQVERGAAKGKITAEKKTEILAALSGTTRLEDLADCDLIIEAVVEDLAVKKEVYARLDAICAPKTIFASNTSSLRVADIAAATKRADRFCGMHFFNPAPLTKLVEVIKADGTSDATHAAALGLARAFGKTAISAKDNSGFVVNFILVPYLLGAVRALEKGFASIEDIDKAMTHGCAHPIGPLSLIDLIGIDTIVKITDIMKAEYRDPMYECPKMVRRMAEKGWFGAKSGRGFYDYTPSGAVPNAAVLDLPGPL